MEDRVVELESLFEHLRRTVVDLNEALLLQDQRLERVERQCQVLEARLRDTPEPEEEL